MTDWKIVGARCREARAYVGCTHAEVADHLGLHRPSYSNIESGLRTVTIEELASLSKLFKRSNDWLLGGRRDAELPAEMVDKVADLPAEDIDELVHFAEFLRFKKTKG